MSGRHAAPATPAPEWRTTRWFNAAPLTLAGLRGRVVALHAFQMLCPGCVFYGLPQAQRIHDNFSRDDVAVVGLHTVFEHHAVNTPEALAAFIHEYRLGFPIGIDEAGEPDGLPRTMRAYGLRGTPSLVLIDHAGMIRKHGFGQEDDMRVGSEIAMLVQEARQAGSRRTAPPAAGTALRAAGVCTPDGCTPG